MGDVVIVVIIGTDGTITETRVITGPDPELERAALENVRQWRYRPTTLNGEPVESVATVSISFRID